MKIDLSLSTPLKIQAYNIIKKAIIIGMFKDNDALSERTVHENFDISRTPFREAIQILEAEGWVYTLPYKGTYVKPMTTKDLEELFELRQVIEPGIIDYFQFNDMNRCLNQLRGILNKMDLNELAQSNLEFMELDREFHRQFYQETKNSYIITISEQISDTMLRVGLKVLNNKSRRKEVIEEHKNIIEGLNNGNAKEQLREHLEKTKESFINLYQEVKFQKNKYVKFQQEK